VKTDGLPQTTGSQPENLCRTLYTVHIWFLQSMALSIGIIDFMRKPVNSLISLTSMPAFVTSYDQWRSPHLRTTQQAGTRWKSVLG